MIERVICSFLLQEAPNSTFKSAITITEHQILIMIVLGSALYYRIYEIIVCAYRVCSCVCVYIFSLWIWREPRASSNTRQVLGVAECASPLCHSHSPPLSHTLSSTHTHAHTHKHTHIGAKARTSSLIARTCAGACKVLVAAAPHHQFARVFERAWCGGTGSGAGVFDYNHYYNYHNC